MSGAKTPTLAHAEAFARRELKRIEDRLSRGVFKHEDLGRLEWAIACQKLLVTNIAAAVNAMRASSGPSSGIERAAPREDDADRESAEA